MFIKIENYYGEKPLILNVDNILSIDFSCNENFPYIRCVENHSYQIDMEQYEQLCRVLK